MSRLKHQQKTKCYQIKSFFASLAKTFRIQISNLKETIYRKSNILFKSLELHHRCKISSYVTERLLHISWKGLKIAGKSCPRPHSERFFFVSFTSLMKYELVALF